MGALQARVATDTTAFEKALLWTFDFGRAFELAAVDGPAHDRNIKHYLGRLEDNELSIEECETPFLDEITTISRKSSEFAPIEVAKAQDHGLSS